MIRKFVLICLIQGFTALLQTVSAQFCIPDTSLHKPGYKPAKLPNVKVDSNYNESISILVKRDTFRMVGSTKVNIKIDSVIADTVLGLPAGYQYECQQNRCVFLWDTVRCVRIYGSTNQSGIYPIIIPVIGYAKIGSSTFIQKDTIRDFTLIVEGDPAGTQSFKRNPGMLIYPVPASENIIFNFLKPPAAPLVIYNSKGEVVSLEIKSENTVYSASVKDLPAGIYYIRSGNLSGKFSIYHQ